MISKSTPAVALLTGRASLCAASPARGTPTLPQQLLQEQDPF